MEVKPEAYKYTIRPSLVYSCEGGIEVDLFHTYCGVKLLPLNLLQSSSMINPLQTEQGLTGRRAAGMLRRGGEDTF